MAHFTRAAHAMKTGEACGIIGGKQARSDYDFSLPECMDGCPCFGVHGKLVYPCQNTGGIDLRNIIHSSRPNCTLVLGAFGAGILNLACIMAISDIAEGQLLSLDHDTDFVMCGCGMCAKSICDNCHASAVLVPCVHCRLTFYCSPECCETALPFHSDICARRCANRIVPGKLVLSQFV